MAFTDLTFAYGSLLTSTQMTQLQDNAINAADVGTVVGYAGSTIPAGWLDCDGSAVSRTTYADLFSAIGTTWGVGDGSTTFNLPDFMGRTLIGVGAGASLTSRALADSGGAETHVLTVAELAYHRHTHSQWLNIGNGSGTTGAKSLTSTGNTSYAGSNSAHNNMQPYAAVKFMIRAFV